MDSPRKGIALGWWALVLLGWSAPLLALDTLRVGSNANIDWRSARDFSAFLALRADSIWVWGTAPNANLATGITTRSGSIRVLVKRLNTIGAMVDVLEEKPGLSAWVDGDPATAWGPDEDGELSRQAKVYLDLGATFRVNRIRLFPRLDREHSSLMLGGFEVGTSGSNGVAEDILKLSYTPVTKFSPFFPNRQSVVDVRFDSREVRYVRLVSQGTEPWELAELEVYADGTVPTGEFISIPLFVRGGFPLWGQVLANGRDAAELPIAIQTRTGPDSEPIQYFFQRGDVLEKVSRRDYLDFDPTKDAGVTLGPVKPNPEWSPWQTLTDGRVISPGPQRYLQFRILMSEPGTGLRDLSFEYVRQPLAGELEAEISPLEVDPGQETEFTLSIEVHLNTGRGDTGIRHLQILTPARVRQVELVLVDDQEAVYSTIYQPEGFSVDLWRRVVQEGSFVQVLFRAAVFRDGTPFQVRAVDVRSEETGTETVYQTAREADVDPLSLGGSLVVRLRSASNALVGLMSPRATLFTPNGDGMNDYFEVSYNLLKLLQPAPVSFAIFDLSGRRVRQGYVGADLAGEYTRIWDGRDDRGELVMPGIYLYQIEVKADTGAERRQGVVQVVY